MDRRTNHRPQQFRSRDFQLESGFRLDARLVLIDPLLHRHGYFETEAMFGFYAICGFAGSAILVLLAIVLRAISMRPEDYYDDR